MPGGSRIDTLSRVFESQISIPQVLASRLSSQEAVAMSWPHGDQIVVQTEHAALAVQQSHKVGTPVTTLATEEVFCWPYSF